MAFGFCSLESLRDYVKQAGDGPYLSTALSPAPADFVLQTNLIVGSLAVRVPLQLRLKVRLQEEVNLNVKEFREMIKQK